MAGTVDAISHAVSAPGKSHQVRRNLVLLAAAVVLALSGIGISLASLTTKTEDPVTHLHRVAGISDPVQRLSALYDVYESTARTNPAAVAVGTRMNAELKAAIAQNREDLKSDPSPHEELVDQANQWVDDLKSGAPLTPPSAPSPPASPTPAPSPQTTQPPAVPSGVGTPSISITR